MDDIIPQENVIHSWENIIFIEKYMRSEDIFNDKNRS